MIIQERRKNKEDEKDTSHYSCFFGQRWKKCKDKNYYWWHLFKGTRRRVLGKSSGENSLARLKEIWHILWGEWIQCPRFSVFLNFDPRSSEGEEAWDLCVRGLRLCMLRQIIRQKGWHVAGDLHIVLRLVQFGTLFWFGL